MQNTGVPILGKQINFKDYLPPGTFVIAHWLGWFGQSNHKNIPNYDSRLAATCDSQCAAMKAMGIDALNSDWYGPDHPFENMASLEMLMACERSGLKYSCCVDHGALANSSANLPSVLNYIAETFAISPAYLTDPATGKPIVNFFGDPGIDVTPIKGNFFFLFQDRSGFTRNGSDGAFGWVHPLANANDINAAYLFDFNNNAAANPTKTAWFPVYPGFDDSQAAWGSKRLMNRRNGLTLLDTLSLIPATAKFVLLVTWNDWEEGSAIEGSQG